MTNKYTVEQLREMLQEVNGWDSSLEDYDYMEMGQLDEMLNSVEPTEVLRMAHFGEFNWSDDYFTINVYGNLESISEFEFEDMLKDNHDEIVGRYNELVEDGDIEPIE